MKIEIQNFDDLRNKFKLSENEKAFKEDDKTLPISITSHFLSLIDLNDERDPLRIQVFPSILEKEEKDFEKNLKYKSIKLEISKDEILNINESSNYELNINKDSNLTIKIESKSPISVNLNLKIKENKKVNFFELSNSKSSYIKKNINLEKNSTLIYSQIILANRTNTTVTELKENSIYNLIGAFRINNEETYIMKNTLLLTSIVALLFSACSKDRVRVKGSGPVVTEERSVNAFDEVSWPAAKRVVASSRSCRSLIGSPVSSYRLWRSMVSRSFGGLGSFRRCSMIPNKFASNHAISFLNRRWRPST